MAVVVGDVVAVGVGGFVNVLVDVITHDCVGVSMAYLWVWVWSYRVGVWGGGGVSALESFGGKFSFFRLVPNSPPSEIFGGPFLAPLFGSQCLLHVRISLCASASPKNFLLCILCIPKNDLPSVPSVYCRRFFCVSAVHPKDCGSCNCTQGTKICGCRKLAHPKFSPPKFSPPESAPPPPL